MFEQERVLVRIQQYILKDEEIAACFLAGSFGRGASDAYSDLDLVLIFKDEDSREAAFAKRKEFVRKLLPYVPAKSFDASHVRPYLHAALYSNGAKVDYLYETFEIVPAFELKDIRLLKDENQWGSGFLSRCALLSPSYKLSTITNSAFIDLDNRFWVMFMDIYRQLLRGEYDKPFSIYLQLQSFTLPALMKLLPPEDASYQELIGLYFSQDCESNIAHMRKLLSSYLSARDSITSRHQLNFQPDLTFERDLMRKIG